MNTLESRLQQAAATAAPPRSIADDVMRRLPPLSAAPPRRRLRYAVVSALSGIAALLVIAFFFTGTSARLTLADVQAAVENQHWVHATHDAGQIREQWYNLQTGEFFAKSVVGITDFVTYVDEKTNIRLSYFKEAGVIDQDTPTIYPPGQAVPKWTPRSAWQVFVTPFEKAEAHEDTLNGIPAVRFDHYGTDGVGNRMLYSQLWADPKTHLPLRIKTRLQLGERDTYHKEWSTADYDFPATGPADIFALGVPVGTPIHKEVTAAPADVQPILDAMHKAHDNFLKSYRAIVWTTYDGNGSNVETLHVIWHDGEKIRDDYYLPAFDKDLPKKATAESLLTWATARKPFAVQLQTDTQTFSWRSQTSNDNPRPQVQVSAHRPGAHSYFDTNGWPETMQWPAENMQPDFQRLPPISDLPDCIGLRYESGNYRADYYVDPKNDYVCRLHIDWAKRDGQWAKSSEFTLSNVQRVADHAVAGTQTHTNYANPDTGTSTVTYTTTIQITPLAAADIPAGTFDPKPLTTGATVEGF